MVKVGNFHISEPVFLAPMSGITDAPFRRQTSRFGAPLVVTEMIAGSELAAGRKDVVWRISNSQQSGPFIVQLAGRDPYWMKIAAEIAADHGADVIDINMGCPSRLVTGGQSGSALMRDLDLAKDLIIATREGGQKPVTVKMRLGWDDDTLNSPELARIAEGEGVELLTVHGRTRCQFYTGHANWKLVKRVKDSCNIPVIVNGDISCESSALLALRESGADGVMIGRAAVGRPWLVGEVASKLYGTEFKVPTWKKKIDSLITQINDSAELYGQTLGVRVVRKHLAAFIDHAFLEFSTEDELKELRAQLCTISDTNSLVETLAALGEPQKNKEMEPA